MPGLPGGGHMGSILELMREIHVRMPVYLAAVPLAEAADGGNVYCIHLCFYTDPQTAHLSPRILTTCPGSPAAGVTRCPACHSADVTGELSSHTAAA